MTSRLIMGVSFVVGFVRVGFGASKTNGLAYVESYM